MSWNKIQETIVVVSERKKKKHTIVYKAQKKKNKKERNFWKELSENELNLTENVLGYQITGLNNQ